MHTPNVIFAVSIIFIAINQESTFSEHISNENANNKLPRRVGAVEKFPFALEKSGGEKF